MNGRSGTMSPVSVDGSDWSGINQYQAVVTAGAKAEPPFSPTFSTVGNLATPPVSGESPVPPTPTTVPSEPAVSPRPPADADNPSPPNSIRGRSSDGTLGGKQQPPQNGRVNRQIEEILSQHYRVLKRFLQNPYREDRSKPNKARDKLLRLSPTQFHELSTDVYDELLRRQQSIPPSPGRPGPPRPEVPSFLPPRKEFHEKRNQARQKLASLQHQRFRDLATDVFCELERRFPHFAARDMPRRPSPAPSARSTASRGGPPNGYGPRPGSHGYGPNGPPSARRSQSRGPPPSPMGRGYPSGNSPQSPMGSPFPPRQGSLGGPPPGMNGDTGPLPKTFQSNMIVPNKSTLVEDDDDGAVTEDEYDARSDAFALDGVLQSRRGTTTTLGDGGRSLLAETQSQVSVLQDKVERLEELVKSKDEELARMQDEQDKSQVCKLDLFFNIFFSPQFESVSLSERQDWEDTKQDLEHKILQAEDLNSSLQLELDRVRAEHKTMEEDLRAQIEESSQRGAGDDEWQTRFGELESQHHSLQNELLEQQKITEEVRREASNFLQEMKMLSEQSQSNWEREDQLSTDVRRLEEEVQEWKDRYAKTRTQLRQLKTPSMGLPGPLPDAGAHAKGNEFLRPDGLIKDVYVTRFQISIDELLRVARSDEPHLVLNQIKAVIFAIRHIIQDVDIPQSPADEMVQLRVKAKGQVSVTANNLITASKNFALSNGLSPVSLLDAAASHVSTAVVELIRLAKIRLTPEDELEEEDEEEVYDPNLAQMQSPDYFSMAPSQDRYSNNESIYSAISTPSVESRAQLESTKLQDSVAIAGLPTGMKMGYNREPEDEETRELKLYLEDQTDVLLQTIQALVASIRSESDPITIRNDVSAISAIVTNVITSTEHTMTRPGADLILQERTESFLQALDHHRGRLVETSAEAQEVPDSDEFREIVSKLPPIAFELARGTKDVVQLLEPIDYDDEEDEDFR
ncbi:hypothetical protein ASPZODRAFT_65687 [Penicilliopsis zonata CBS 506.65]|uniref:GIT Spa2 homology (SHD) domain-containing protein n=1 Tax=Penicilliopsis zonata CBS 506.65 TaxID=1073090 RepID=A0A1L9SIF7_9EURO|nr:hypothetical protein ASPZODRAFT_65687 [Penicilliopsis zonata CBS 506.65]OJJ46978.1 hypothetical protein ASPZODRAFT_65687 [Penicilliopsis zonata CBS 506.65]